MCVVSCLVACTDTYRFVSSMQRQITGVSSAYAALNVPAAQLWPYKFVSGLLSRIIDKINFQTETQVDSVSSMPDDEGYYTLSTKSRGSVRAKKVVFATNAYTAALLPELYEDKLVPVRGTASHVVRRDQSVGQFRDLQQRVNTYNLAYGGTLQDYLVHRPDGGVIFGGGYSVFGSREELVRGTVDDSEVAMEKEMTAYFERRMAESYADWAVSGAKVDRIWTGSEFFQCLLLCGQGSSQWFSMSCWSYFVSEHLANRFEIEINSHGRHS